MKEQQIEIYQSDKGQSVQVRFEDESLWLTQAQISDLFDKDVRTINEHIKNIFKEQELTESEATIRKFRIVRQEGSRQVRRDIEHYNLDMVISVGYRVNSKKGTHFRIWATRRLKEYLLQRSQSTQHRFDQNAEVLKKALELVQTAAQSPELTLDAGRGLVDIVSRYTHTFLWLQKYDEGLLDEPKGQSGGKLPTPREASESLAKLKQDLIARGEATDLFARARGDGLEALLGNLDQTVFGEPAYPTIESKAAHLLYFVVMYRMYCMQRAHGCAGAAKNHPFTDGNKRSGAFLFVDFLHRNQRLLDAQGNPCINDTGLAALTLLVAESKPDQKETLIRLIMNMLAGEDSA